MTKTDLLSKDLLREETTEDQGTGFDVGSLNSIDRAPAKKENHSPFLGSRSDKVNANTDNPLIY